MGIIGELTTPLGLSVSQLRSGLMYVFNVDISPYLLMFIIELIALISVATGLKRGVKWLSNTSITLVIRLLVIVFSLGVFTFEITTLISYITNGVESYLTNIDKFNNSFVTASNQWAASVIMELL